MPDLTAIAAAVAAFNNAKNIAQTMIGLRDAAAFQSKMIEFQSAILEAQSSAFAANEERSTLVEKVRQLEAKVASLEAWDAEKQKYELKELRAGVFAYVLKEDAGTSEPSHLICASCYQQCEKSLLYKEHLSVGRAELLICPRCGTEMYTSGHWYPEHAQRRAPSRRR